MKKLVNLVLAAVIVTFSFSATVIKNAKMKALVSFDDTTNGDQGLNCNG